MIKKERLQELIRDKKKIYEGGNGWTQIIDTNEYCCISGEDDWMFLHDVDMNKMVTIDCLFETEESAKWYSEFGNLRRWQELSLPQWDVVYNDLRNEPEGRYVIAEVSDISFEYERAFTDQILLFNKYDRWNWNATKENYFKACEMCRSLFWGYNDENRD